MAGSSYNRNNVLAGLFLLLGIGLAVGVSFILQERGPRGRTMEFTVRFSLAEGAAGIKRGSPVLLGGQQIGRVKWAKVLQKEGDEPLPTGIAVRVEVRASLLLYENASVLLEMPLLGALSSINIVHPGNASEVTSPQGTPRIEDGDVIQGRVAPPAFLAQAGFGPEQGQQVKRIIGSAESAVDRLNALLTDTTPKLNKSIDDIAAITGSFRSDMDRWSGMVDEILKKTDSAAGKVNPLLTHADASLDLFDKAVGDIRGVITENRSRIDETLESIRQITERFNGEGISNLNAALKDARDALGSFSKAVDRAESLLASEAPGVRRILANLRLMSDQLKLTAIEVRSQPWRLLVKPDTKEFESQVLYDATRAFATASSDLRGASEALEAALAAAQDGTPAQREQIDTLSKSLSDSFGNYRKAEQDLLDVLVKQREK